MLFGAQDMQDFVEKYKYMDVIAEADQHMLDQLQVQQEEIAKKSVELRHQIQLAEEASKAAQTETARLLAQEQKRQQLLHKYRTEKGTHNRALKELRAAGAKLEERLGIVSDEHLEKQAQAIGGIRPALFGKLPLARWRGSCTKSKPHRPWPDHPKPKKGNPCAVLQMVLSQTLNQL